MGAKRWALLLFLGSAISFSAIAQVDVLPSWNNTSAKKDILVFIDKVTKAGTPDFVPVPERIAVFDNDGTLWPENPLPFQVAFVAYEIARQLPDHPEWKTDPAIQAFKKGDLAALTADNNQLLLRIIALTHTGITTEEFDQRVKDWATKDTHPRFKRPYTECVYQPMLELLAYLRANGFQTWIVSGGGKDFMRVWTESVYGIPPEQVIGSYGQIKFEMKDGKPILTKTLDSVFVDDKGGKPVGIYQFIGRRPIAAFGNSDGDQAMLEYTTIDNPLSSFGLLVHHTDGEREYAYDAHPKSSGKLVTALTEAPQRGWTVVDMKADWKSIFPPAK